MVPRPDLSSKAPRVDVSQPALCASRYPRTRETASLPESFAHSKLLNFVERRRSATAFIPGPLRREEIFALTYLR